jgi:adenine/guanine/hypoxanthine permease
VTGGLTTYATMCYIVFVQPAVLQAAGMPFGSVLLATCLSSAAACFLMGLVARYPFALAPGMGENFLFAFTICGPAAMGGFGFSWQAGLALVFLSGLLFLALSLVGFREKVLDVLPECLKNAIGPAIGMFIAFVGLQWGGIIVHSPATMVRLGSFHHPAPLIALAGVFLTAALLARGVRAGILVGILFSGAMCLLTGVIPAGGGEPVTLSTETFFRLSFTELITKWDQALIAVALFFFLDLFDTVGTLVGVSRQAGFMDDDGRLPRAGRAFFADAAGTCLGALFGTSTVTSYIESASGVAVGARTGLAAVVTGCCFLLSVVLAPLVALVGHDIGPAFYGADSGLFIRMYPAVAPALIVVGFLMMAPLRRVNWDDITESLPAFLTVAVMTLGYGITEGVAAGCVSFAAVKLLAGRPREVHPVMLAIAVALVLRYAFLME